MNLTDLISNYQFILRNRGRKESQTFLHQAIVDMHLLSEDVAIWLQKAIPACFDDSGNEIW